MIKGTGAIPNSVEKAQQAVAFAVPVGLFLFLAPAGYATSQEQARAPEIPLS